MVVFKIFSPTLEPQSKPKPSCQSEPDLYSVVYDVFKSVGFDEVVVRALAKMPDVQQAIKNTLDHLATMVIIGRLSSQQASESLCRVCWNAKQFMDHLRPGWEQRCKERSDNG